MLRWSCIPTGRAYCENWWRQRMWKWSVQTYSISRRVQGFDRVLADVPCSGTGTLAHNPEIKWRLKPRDLADLQRRQIAILSAGMRQVVPEGRLVYSTCSLEPEENEDVVARALSGEPSFRIVDCRAELERLRAEGELVWSDVDSLVSGRFMRTISRGASVRRFFCRDLAEAV